MLRVFQVSEGDPLLGSKTLKNYEVCMVYWAVKPSKAMRYVYQTFGKLRVEISKGIMKPCIVSNFHLAGTLIVCCAFNIDM